MCPLFAISLQKTKQHIFSNSSELQIFNSSLQRQHATQKKECKALFSSQTFTSNSNAWLLTCPPAGTSQIQGSRLQVRSSSPGGQTAICLPTHPRSQPERGDSPTAEAGATHQRLSHFFLPFPLPLLSPVFPSLPPSPFLKPQSKVRGL